jgi:radical SAM superfamily enzyme YgiQ (UPF0313 family)
MKNKYDIVLIQPRTISPYRIYNLPFGPLFLAPKLRQAGFRVFIFDERFDNRDELLGVVKDNEIVLCGLTVFTGPNITSALNLSRALKKAKPRLPVVWGGPHPSILDGQTLEEDAIDIAARGEGEYILLELALALREGRGIENIGGISFKRNGQIIPVPGKKEILDWDKEVSMALDLIDLRKYIFEYKGLSSIHIITSRGCPFRCSFCWNKLCGGRAFKAWSPEKIKKEVQPFLNMGVRRFILNDAFMGASKRIADIGNLFKELNCAYAIEDGLRVDIHADEGLFGKLRDTGCHHISFGAESGSQGILDLLKKDITPGQIINSAELSARYKLGVKYAWMIGMPGETYADVLSTVKTIDRIKEICPDSAHSMSFFSPYPGTELFEKAVKSGWVSPQRLSQWGIFREEMSYPYLKDIWAYKSVMYSNFFIHAANTENAIWKQTKRKYFFLTKILALTSSLRWRWRIFKWPFEFMAGERLRRYLKKWIEQ